MGDDPRGPHTLGQVLKRLRAAVDEHQDSIHSVSRTYGAFEPVAGYSDSRLRCGADESAVWDPGGDAKWRQTVYRKSLRIPSRILSIFLRHATECPKRMDAHRMLIPRSFMFRKTGQGHSERISWRDRDFDFLAEFGYDILDNAMVGTVGTVIPNWSQLAIKRETFIRLHDPTQRKNLRNKVHSFIIRRSIRRGHTMEKIRRYTSQPFSDSR